VVIDRVDPDGVAASAGLMPGLVIYKLGRTSVRSVGDFERAMEQQDPEEGVLLSMRTPRGNQVMVLKAD
jgi:S1-C subfamily serine protease